MTAVPSIINLFLFLLLSLFIQIVTIGIKHYRSKKDRYQNKAIKLLMELPLKYDRQILKQAVLLTRS